MPDESLWAAFERLGNVTLAAKAVGVNRCTASEKLNKDKPRYLAIKARLGSAGDRSVSISRPKAETATGVPQVTHYPGDRFGSALPEPAPEAGGASLPEPVDLRWEPFVIDGPAVVGVISDVHLPYHDRRTIEGWVKECKQRNASVLLLNGDILDCGAVSDHYREPNETRLEEELEAGIQFLAYLRAQFPSARILFKEGNHDFRLTRFLANVAPELFNLKQLRLPSLLEFDKFGVEWIADKRVVMLGKLPVIHGHEYRGGGGVMPARWLFLRTGGSAMCGHFHQPSYYTFRSIERKEVGVWSTGCACYLSPRYAPLNQWGHGWAIVDVAQGGHYVVTNRRLLNDGSVA